MRRAALALVVCLWGQSAWAQDPGSEAEEGDEAEIRLLDQEPDPEPSEADTPDEEKGEADAEEAPRDSGVRRARGSRRTKSSTRAQENHRREPRPKAGSEAALRPPPELPPPSPAPSPAPSPLPSPSARPVEEPPPVRIPTETIVPPPPPSPSADLQVTERLRTLVRAIEAGERDVVDLELARISELREIAGVRNVPLASMALIRRARQLLADRDPERAAFFADAAARLSPDLEGAHWLRAQVTLQRENGGPLAAVGAAIEAIGGSFRGFRNRVARVTNLVVVALLALLGALAVFVLLQLLRYGRCMAADLARLLPPWAGRGVALLLLLILLVLPPALGLGAVTCLLLWIVALIPYQVRRERAVATFAIVLLAASPFVLDLVARLVVFHGSTVDALAAISSELPAQDAEARLREELRRSASGDQDAAFLIAMRAKRRGELAEGERWYREAARLDPANIAARNNLGVVLYLQHQKTEAMQELSSASRGQTCAPAFLNIATIHLDESRFDDARRAIDSARAIDPDAAARYSAADTSLPAAERLLDVPFDQRRLWDRLRATSDASRDAVRAQLWARLGGWLPWMAQPILALVLGVLALLAARKSERFATPCERCGQPARKSKVESVCDPCGSIFLQGTAVTAAVRLKKERAVARRQRQETWVPRLLSPLAGVGHILSGRAAEGLILLALFLGVFMQIFWADQLSVHAWGVGSEIGALEWGFAAAGAGLLSLFSLIRVVRQ
ncbi:MAG: hypothetical protein IT384_27390 [Deltaproteobacteria bacterium]|nr:hypothetical protein [Deltaproteobacteria bacterium]